MLPHMVADDVPCGDCSACCTESLVVLNPSNGDNPNILTRHQVVGPALVLDRDANGVCVYLEDGRCSVWAHRPLVCRAFDCRGLYRSKTRAERRRMVKNGEIQQAVFDAAKARLHTLDDESPHLASIQRGAAIGRRS